MNGKVIVIGLLVLSALFGAGMYYMQVYGYYYEVTPRPGQDVTLVSVASGRPEPVAYADFRAIDADSSPIRYRACFTLSEEPAALAGRFVELPPKAPRVAPDWFDCFEEEAIDAGLKDGSVRLYLGQKNIHYGVDRVVAVASDGRGWAWNEPNDCGRKAWDGTPVGEACPPRPGKAAE